MLRSKEVLTAVGTLACAIAIGFVMQKSETAQELYGKKQPTEAPVLKGAGLNNSLLDVQEITLTSAEYKTGIALPKPDAEVITASTPSSTLSTPDAPQATVTPACDVVANARPVAAAMVNLTMEASCLPNERVTVHHNGMIFTVTTSADGKIDIKVPALAEEAVFILAFSNGEGAVAQTTVDELKDYNRAVLQWKGNTGFEIHAREFGAAYNTKGHLWVNAPGDIVDAVAGNSGVLTRHGDVNAAEPLLAEVYSFPKAYTEYSGNIALSVEAEVTELNCGLEIEAQSLELQDDGAIKTQNLTLPVPDCDAKGSFLVLNNLLQDLKVAGR